MPRYRMTIEAVVYATISKEIEAEEMYRFWKTLSDNEKKQIEQKIVSEFVKIVD